MKGQSALFRVRHDGTRFRADGEGFDAAAYSRFKYGSDRAAGEYGRRMAGPLLDVHPHASRAPETVVLASAAYKHTPSAAHAVFKAMHVELLERGVLVPVTRILRENLVEGDYGTLGAADRERLMQANGLSVDPESVAGKHVVVVDDVRITGSHERSVERLMDTVGPASTTFLYLVDLDRDQASADPAFEDRLNHALVRDLPSYAALVDSEPCTLNARSVKSALDPRNGSDLAAFVRSRSRAWVEHLVACAAADGYDLMGTYGPSYRQALAHLARRPVPAGVTG